jgi:molybdopterin converting factor small subunit
MKVRVRLFAVAKELAGHETLNLDVPVAAKLSDVRKAIEKQFPALRSVLRHALWAVDAAYADDETSVDEDSDVAVIPPVSGG